MFGPDGAPMMVRDAFAGAAKAMPEAGKPVASTDRQPDAQKAKRHIFHALQALHGKKCPDPDHEG